MKLCPSEADIRPVSRREHYVSDYLLAGIEGCGYKDQACLFIAYHDDTYDYLDKLIDFKLADIYYAAFKKYAEKKDDARALIIAKLIKYGTSDEKTIWMLKYGMSFEDIKKLGRYVLEINNKHIIFSSSISEVSESDKECIKRFL